MTAHSTLPARWLSRTVGALLVLVAFAGPALHAGPAAAARATRDTPLDLAALALTPDDLRDEGLEGFGISDGQTLSPSSAAASVAFERDIPADDVEDGFADAGLVRAYELRLDLPGSGDVPAQSIRSTLREFADEDGAADAFATLTDWEHSQAESESLDLPDLGDDSALIHLTGTTNQPFLALDLTVWTGRFVAAVRLVDFTGDDPSESDVEHLATRLVDRIEAGSETETAQLERQTLRLSGDGVSPISDYYTATDGRPRATAGQSASDVAADAEDLSDAGMTDEYFARQQVATFGTPTRDTYFYSSVQQFFDEDAASAYLQATEDRLADDDTFDDLEQIEGLREYGDDSIAFGQTYHVASEDLVLQYEMYFVQVGSKVADIELIAPDWTPYGALEDLAAAQAECLEQDACAESVPLPPALASMVDEAAGEEEPDAGSEHNTPIPSRPRTYLGPTFGVELTYDPTDWSVMVESSSDDTDTLALFEEGTTSMVTLTSYPAYHDATACIEDLTSGFADDEAFGVAKPVRDDDGEPIADADPETAYAAYGLVPDADGDIFAYFECRAFADGEDTLLITQVGPLAEYPDRAASREALLEDLVLPDA